MTGKELLLQKLKNYIETGEITKSDALALFGEPEKEAEAGPSSVIQLPGEIEQKQRFIFLPFFIVLVLILSGVYFTLQSWDTMESFTRALLTLGSGIAAYVLGMFTLHKNNPVGTLLHLLAGVLLPLGVIISIDAFGPFVNARFSLVLLTLFLSLLYALSFRIAKHPIVLFLFLLSITGFLYSLLYILGDKDLNVPYLYATFAVGATYVLLGYFFTKTAGNAMLSFPLHAVGVSLVLGPAFMFLSSSAIADLLYAALLIAVFILALVLRSKGIIAAALLFLFGYLFYSISNYLTSDVHPLLTLAITFFALALLMGLGLIAERRRMQKVL